MVGELDEGDMNNAQIAATLEIAIGARIGVYGKILQSHESSNEWGYSIMLHSYMELPHCYAPRQIL
jgi:hypothetical protein